MSEAVKSPVYFVSLGCPKNLVDSQVMLGMLEKDRYTIAKEADEAEVIIVNTCSFIQAYKEESIETILEMAELKQSGKCKVLVASGCLPQRYSKELEKDMPEVDLFIGTGQYHRITEILNTHGQARELGAASVCIKPYAVRLAAKLLAGSTVQASTVIGVPHGGHLTAVKVFEAERALDDARPNSTWW